MNFSAIPSNAREESILKWLPLARVMAASEFRRLGSLTRLLQVDFDDLFQTAMVGLILAVDRFDPELSAPKTYFSKRIRGSLLDFERSFPFFKNGAAVERVDEAELAFRPTNCVELERTEARIDFERLVSLLSEKQQSVICGIVREIPQHRMAQSLGVNESRISQIKNESLDAMRSIARKQVA
ncbi:MAG TPA: sigma-70 family RNA polymerase sigma factor [Terriglobia bacterium]|nr:sigma-70 family RNA polymerase sigma factor [Terriglobia bacterium]